MTGRRKIAIGAAVALGLLITVVVVGILIVRSQWFASQVRQRIVSTLEGSTGGRVEMRGFQFQWNHLHAVIENFTIHGLEPAGSPPLFTVPRAVIDFRLLSPLQGGINIAALQLESPRINVMVLPDGRNNIPHPPSSSNSGKPLEGIVNLAVGRFRIVHGTATFADRPASFDAQGQNLAAHFDYDPRRPGYTGEIDASPLVLQTGGRPAVDMNLKLPAIIEADRIVVSNARLANARSAIDLSGQVAHLNAPAGWARLHADVAPADLDRLTGLTFQAQTGSAPARLRADVAANVTPKGLQIQKADVSLGESRLQVTGALAGTGNLSFDLRLALGQIANMLHWAARPAGTAVIHGAMQMGSNGWAVHANVEARNFDLVEGSTALRHLTFTSAIAANPRQVELTGMHLTGAPLGPQGAFTGTAKVENLRAFDVQGELRRVNVEIISRLFLAKPPAFAGMVSGPLQLQGDFKNFKNLTARAQLAIAPGGGPGVPLSGRINVNYNGRAESVVFGPSRLQLPHTRIDLAGALNRRIQVTLVSHNLNDLRPLGDIPLELVNGTATITAAVTGRLSAPHIQGHAAVTDFAVSGRRFTSFSGDLAASPSAVSVSNAVLTRGPLRADLSATLGLRQWKTAPTAPLRVDATVRNADLADVLALAQKPIPASGAFTADVHIAGTLGSPTGDAQVNIADGSIEGEHFDTLAAHAVLTPQDIGIPAFSVAAGASHIDATADYSHPVNHLDQGTLHVRLAGNQVQLADFRRLAKAGQAVASANPNFPNVSGVLNVNADFRANASPSPQGTQWQIAGLDGNFAVHNLLLDNRSLGNLTAAVNTSAGALHYTANSDFAGSTIRVSGQSLLADGHPTTADLQLANFPIQPALAVAGRDLPLSGTVTASAQVSGTLADPHIAATVTVLHGSAWQQPFDRIQTAVQYSNTLLQVSGLRLTLGPSYLAADAAFTHPAGDFQHGQIRFRADSSPIPLAQVHALAAVEPGLAGTVQVSGEGAATLHPGALPLFSTLDGSLNARGVALSGQPLGDLTASARTSGGQADFTLVSDFAHADLHGSGRLQLAGDYPLDAQLNFTNLTYAALRPFLRGPDTPLQAVADGSATIGGPLERPSELHGTLRLARLEIKSPPPTAGRQTRVAVDIRNSGPMVADLSRGVLTIQSARLTGAYTQLSVTGSVALTGAKGFDVHTQGNLNLAFLQAFNPDLYSSGQVTLAAAVTGSLAHPAVNGRLQLSGVSLSLADIPNGVSNAGGVIVFNGTEAFIQNFTAESGGGKITLAGVIGYGGPRTQVRLNLGAERVWVEYPQTVTTEASAKLSLAGTTDHSVLSGDVTIVNVALHPQTDLGSLLTQAASRPAVTPAPVSFLNGIDFDVRIRTAPDAQFRTSLVENLQAEANLTLRGTPVYPGILGRILITQGQVRFFGNRYTLDQGTISFFNPNRVDPNLNVDLETTVQGVQVTVSVTGPMSRLNLTYRSEPPMQFSDLFALLTSGQLPTNDPVLAAHAPPLPSQGFAQAGASALLGAAVTQPVTGRLQRLFGVTTLQVNPQILGSLNNTTQATLTVQQQVAPNITVTYIHDITQSNPMAVQIQWDLNRRWSAVAQRDINGFFDLDFYWKKRFH